MTARELGKTRTKIKRLLKEWIPLLELEKWTLNISYEAKVPAGEEAEEGWDYYADAEPSWEYSTAIIRFFLEPLSGVTSKELEETVVHELVHCVVNEMRDKNIKHEERVVSILTKALMKERHT